MNDFEFMLEDRIAKIKAINEQYDLENNGYISFSGGKDSCVLSKIIDLALPNNKIPRVYFNTGIEYKDMVDFVKDLANNDSRFQIIASGVNIKKMLEKDGYPFKSKQHAHNWAIYNNNKKEIADILGKIRKNKKLLEDYDFIHNLPKGVKTIVKYIFNVRERERDLYQFQGYP